MNKRIKKKRLKNCGFVKHRKDLKWKLKHGYKFPWVSEQGPCPIPLCVPGDCIICRFCSDVFLDWNGPYAVVCRFGRHEGNCKSFMLDEDQPLFHPEDRKNIDAYIDRIRNHNDSDKGMQDIVNNQDLFNDEEIIEYLDKLYEEKKDRLEAIHNEFINEINEFISADAVVKSFNPYKYFSAEEIIALASIGKKLKESSFNVNDLSDVERSAFNKLTQRMYEEKDKFEDELIRKYLNDLHGDDIIDIDEFTTEEGNET